MTQSSEHFALLMADLWGRKGDAGLIVRPVESDLPEPSRLLLGVDAQGRRHVLAPITEDYAFTPEQGEAVELTDWRNPDTNVRYLDLVSHEESLAQAFEQLTDSIINRMDRHAPHIAMQEALDDMRSLLKPARSLTKERARGIFGELVGLGWLSKRNPHYALDAWRGPENYVHDFSTPFGDLEVKSAESDARTVTISSLSQLDEVAGTPLVLVRLHVPSAPQGETLGDLVDRLVGGGINRADLVHKLEGEGFRLGIDSDEHRFVAPQGALAWRVGDAFPGLRSSDLPEERGKAILRVKYTLDLLSAPGEITNDELNDYLDRMMTT